MMSPYESDAIEAKMAEYLFTQKVAGTKYALTGHLDRGCIEFRAAFDDAMNAIVLQCYTKVYGRKSDHVVVVKQPWDWWQAFRERWFPKVWLQAYPVRYKETHVRAEEFLPYTPPLKGDTVLIRRVYIPNESAAGK